jgi:hypothetical protein
MRNVFNKFIQRGKRSKAHNYLYSACASLRCIIRVPRILSIFINLLGELQIPLIFTSARRGSVVVLVPVPVLRNKCETLSVHTFFKSVPKFEYKQRRKRNYPFPKQVKDELVKQTIDAPSSTVIRARDKTFLTLFEERANEIYRWR